MAGHAHTVFVLWQSEQLPTTVHAHALAAVHRDHHAQGMARTQRKGWLMPCKH